MTSMSPLNNYTKLSSKLGRSAQNKNISISPSNAMIFKATTTTMMQQKKNQIKPVRGEQSRLFQTQQRQNESIMSTSNFGDYQTMSMLPKKNNIKSQKSSLVLSSLVAAGNRKTSPSALENNKQESAEFMTKQSKQLTAQLK